MIDLAAIAKQTLTSPVYYETLKPQPNQVRTDIESVLRQNMSHRELQSFPELTELMIDELERVVYDYHENEKYDETEDPNTYHDNLGDGR